MNDDAPWEFLLEIQWWKGTSFIQRFHAWSVSGWKIVWDQAWPLYDLQRSYKNVRAAERRLGIIR